MAKRVLYKFNEEAITDKGKVKHTRVCETISPYITNTTRLVNACKFNMKTEKESSQAIEIVHTRSLVYSEFLDLYHNDEYLEMVMVVNHDNKKLQVYVSDSTSLNSLYTNLYLFILNNLNNKTREANEFINLENFCKVHRSSEPLIYDISLRKIDCENNSLFLTDVLNDKNMDEYSFTTFKDLDNKISKILYDVSFSSQQLFCLYSDDGTLTCYNSAFYKIYKYSMNERTRNINIVTSE